MEDYTYIYRVTYYDDNGMKEKTEYGIFYAATYKDATERLVHEYGETEIIDFELKCIDDTPIFLSEYWYNKIKESNENKIV